MFYGTAYFRISVFLIGANDNFYVLFVCDYNILSPAKFSGLANYKKMITDDTFWLSLKVTFYFAFVSVPLKLIFALL